MNIENFDSEKAQSNLSYSNFNETNPEISDNFDFTNNDNAFVPAQESPNDKCVGSVEKLHNFK